MLRINSGIFKGCKISTLPGRTVRPILARVRKSMFDILVNRIENSFFLDLYAGSGCVGIEALSRGAQKVVFVDNSNLCVNIIKKNLVKLRFLPPENNNHKYLPELTTDFSLPDLPVAIWNYTLPQDLGTRYKFDLIFIGAPYHDVQHIPLNLTLPTISLIAKKDILNPTGLIIAQHQIKERVLECDIKFVCYRQERFGDTMLSFYRAR